MPKPNHVLAKFGRNLRKHREARDLTQEGLAEKANLDRTYISDTERGTRNIGIKNVARLAKTLGITSSILMEDVDQ
jgi:transcriptional regulator with XRE-family HTH domain